MAVNDNVNIIKDIFMGDSAFKLTTVASNTDGLIGIPIDDQVYYTWVLPPCDDEPIAIQPQVHAKWYCIHCGRPNWLDRLTCEGCGAPEGEG